MKTKLTKYLEKLMKAIHKKDTLRAKEQLKKHGVKVENDLD